MARIRCEETKRRERGEASRVFSKIFMGGLQTLVALVVVFAFVSSAHAAWYSANWTYRKKLTIDYTKVGATLSHFAVLVSLTTDSDLAANAQDDGDDILFTSSDGTTKLDHEIEYFNGSTGQLIAWVRIPSLSNSADTEIYMYYGYGSATNQQNVTGVWNDNGGTATNYKGVWHMNQTSGTTIADSCSAANTGTASGGPTLGATGKIGNAIHFDGTNDYIYTTNSQNNPQNFTYEAWVQFGGDDTGAPFIDFESSRTGTGSGSWDRNLYYGEGDGKIYFQVGGSGQEVAVSTSGYYDTTWRHVAAVHNSSNNYFYLYVNGTQVGSNTSGTAGQNFTGYWRMGSYQTDNQPNGASGFLYCGLDEVRISLTNRDATWISTEYNNQSNPGPGSGAFFKTLGSQETNTNVDLANHAAGQEADKFGSNSSVTGAELFAFKLTNNTASTQTVTQVQVQLSSVTGLVQGDFANVKIYVDANNDGAIGGGETTTVGGTGSVDSGVTTITFSTSFTISASTTVNYIMKGDVSNLIGGDTVTIALGTSNITLQSGTVGGSSPTNATHTCTSLNLTEVHYRWRNNDGGEGGLNTGTGADGSATISTSKNINTDVLGSSRSTNADGIVTTVTANPTGTSITVTSTTGFAANDEILLINLRGASGDTADVGNYEFLTVSSVPNGTTLNVSSTIQKSYDGTTFSNQKVVVQRVPQWTNVTVSSGGTLTANDWAGSSGGVIVFRATGTVNVQSGGTISANAKGYQGGAGGTTGGGTNGESYDGTVGSGGNATSTGTSGGGTGDSTTGKGTQTSRGGGGGGGADGGGDATDGAGGGAGGG